MTLASRIERQRRLAAGIVGGHEPSTADDLCEALERVDRAIAAAPDSTDRDPLVITRRSLIEQLKEKTNAHHP